MTTRYYCGNYPLAPGADVQLSDEESHHLIKVMRGRPGEHVIVFGDGGQYEAVISAAGKGSAAVLKVGDPVAGPPLPSVRMTFLIPWIKGGKTDLVVQKLTELGVLGLIIFQAEREVARGDESKLDRLRRVALEACKQCERIDLPKLQLAPSLLAAIQLSPEIPVANRFLLHEREGATKFTSVVASAVKQSSDVLFASGPEGGWHPHELNTVQGLVTFVSLGPRILRAETAPLVAAAAALALAGDI